MNTERTIYSTARRLLLMAFSAIGIVVATSCGDDGMDGPQVSDPKEGYITINLFNSEMQTRDTEPDDQFNENRLQYVNLYLFTATAADDAAPVYSKRYTLNATTSYAVQEKLTRELIAELFPVGSENKALAYVVANLPNSYSFPTEITLGALRTLPVTSNFATNQQQSSFVMNGEKTINLTYDSDNPSKSYVSGEVRLQRAASKITLAVSIPTDIVTNGVEDNGSTWRPVTSSMNVLINNGVNKSRVNPTYVADDLSYFSTSTAENTQIGFTQNTEESDTLKSTFNCNLPLYTYPNKWSEENQDKMTFLTLNLQWTNGSSYRNCYYMVPVTKETQLVRNTSYRVSVNVGILGNYTPEEPLELTNVSYQAVAWGSAPVDVNIADYRYLVFDRTSYVVNNENQTAISFYSSHDAEVTINNVSMSYYAYNTRADGVARKITITQEINDSTKNHNDGKGVYDVYVQANIDNTNINDVNSVTGTRTLVVDHPLVQWTPHSKTNGSVVVLGPNAQTGAYPAEDMMNASIGSIGWYTPTQDAAYSIYEFDITISHKDNPTYSETIHVTQYPAMYIETDLNEGATYRVQVYYSSANHNEEANYGYAFVNAQRNTNVNNNNNYLWSCITYGSLLPVGHSSNNGNPNMYKISITKLDAAAGDEVYVIADPRSTSIDNLNGTGTASSDATWCNQAADMSGTTRRLRYYYPTREDADAKLIVAPRLRTASSFGEMRGRLSKDDAKKRCATYQERGYPAGRWRLPTYGEMKYIVGLAGSGKIPRLFNVNDNMDNSYYWTAQGAYKVKPDGSGDLIDYTTGSPDGTKTTHFVRCVYDDWYWTDTLSYNASADVGLQYVYTFGDRQM